MAAPFGLGRTTAAAIACLSAMVLAGCGSQAPAAFDPDGVPEAYARPTAALAWPGAARGFQVTPDGDLENGEWRVRVTATSAGVRAAAPRAIAYEDRWLPVAHWRRRSGDVRWDFEAVALPDGATPRDTGLFVSLQVTAVNLADGPRDARLSLGAAALDSASIFRAADGPRAERTTADWAGTGAPAARGWCAPPLQDGAAAWTLPAHGSATARLVLSAYPATDAALAAWARVPHARRVAETRSAWQAQVDAGTAFALGDPETERALRAARVTLLTCRERRGDRWVAIGSPFQYRDVWLRDGARAIRALCVAGHVAEARACARGLELLRWDDGSFLSQRGQLDGTGQAIWAFDQAFLRPAVDDSAVATLADHGLAAVRWGELERHLGVTPPPYGRMLAWCNPRDNELVIAQLTGNDAWLIAGYRSAARLLRAAGRAADADSADAARARYVADFHAALDASGAPDVPPCWPPERGGRDWGNVAACVPCGAIAVSDPRQAGLAARLWAGSGGPGHGWYGVRDSVHTYVFADLATWAMLTGRRAAAEAMLDSLLAARSATGGMAELFSGRTRDWGRNAPPHATSAAALVQLVRDAIVYDEDDTLRVTLGARERWWRGASLRRAPTRWGTIDLAFERNGDRATWRFGKVAAWTALTLPPGAVLAEPPPAPCTGARGDTRVLAPPGTTAVTVALGPGR